MDNSSPLKQKVYDLTNPFVDSNEFNFGANNNENLYEPLFFVMVATETSNESAPRDTFEKLYSLIYSYRSQDSEEIDYLVDYSESLIGHIEFVENSNEWENIYNAYGKVLQSLDKEDKVEYFSSLARVGFLLKKMEETDDFAEKYVYRLSKLEKFLDLQKSEIVKIFEDAKFDAEFDFDSMQNDEEDAFDFGDSEEESETNDEIEDFNEGDEFDFGDHSDDEIDNIGKKKNSLSVEQKIEKLKELKQLLDGGVIDQNEFNKMKSELL